VTVSFFGWVLSCSIHLIGIQSRELILFPDRAMKVDALGSNDRILEGGTRSVDHLWVRCLGIGLDVVLEGKGAFHVDSC
jgi:hypothetical protein